MVNLIHIVAKNKDVLASTKCQIFVTRFNTCETIDINAH